MEKNKKVVVAVRVRPKLAAASNASHVAEKYHVDAATKVSETVIRIEPPAGADKSLSNQPSGAPGTDKESRKTAFCFDCVFDKDNSQLEVYEELAVEAVDRAITFGCDATIMAYGQTGSGKTYTVLGAVGDNPLSSDVVVPETGLFLRSLQDIFQYAEARRNDLHLVVGLSAIEVYLDQVRDLLGAIKGGEPTNLKIVLDAERMRIPDLTYRPVTKIQDAVNAYSVATSRRASRATDCNDQSSRSHALFCIDVYQQKIDKKVNPHPPKLLDILAAREKGAGTVKSTVDPATAPIDVSQLSNPVIRLQGQPPIIVSHIILTDLAGSEKVKNSNAKGDAFDEMKKINGSLTALGNVVHSLFAGSKHVPYRDAKLTQLLRSTFAAPNSRIVLIANLAPTALTFDESLSTLFFADKMKGIKVDPSAAGHSGDAKLEADFLRLTKDSEELTAELRVVRRIFWDHHAAVHKGMCAKAGMAPNASVGAYKPLFRAYGKGESKDYKAVMSKVAEGMETFLKTSRQNDQASNEKAAKDAYDHIVNEARKRHREVLDGLQKSYDSLQQDEQQAEAEVAEVLHNLKDEAEKTAKAVDSLEKKFADAQAKKAEARQVIEQCNVEEKNLMEEIAKHQDDEVTQEQKAILDDYKALEKAAERHQLYKGFFDARKAYIEAKAKYIRALYDCTKLRRVKTQVKFDLEHFESNHICSSIVRDIVEKVFGGQRELRIGPLTATSPSTSNAEASNPRSPTTRRSTVARGEATTPYDNPGLLAKVLSFLQGGCRLLKYGREGQPHYRYFYIEISKEEERVFLRWENETPWRRSKDSNVVDIFSVDRIVIGRSSDVFRRQHRDKDQYFLDPSYYFSFSIYCVREQKPSTLDLTASSSSEMTAWVMGLCYIARLVPEFGETCDLTKAVPPLSEAPPKKVNFLEQFQKPSGGPSGIRSTEWLERLKKSCVGARFLENDEEIRLCQKWHIPPWALYNFKARVVRVAAAQDVESAKGKSNVLTPCPLSPGEIHTVLRLDIFRAEKVWEYLQVVGMAVPIPDCGQFMNFDRV